MTGFKSDVMVLIGRVCVAAIFLMSGVYKIFDFNGTVQKIIEETMIQPHLFAVGVTCFVIVLELAGGLSVAIGYKSKIGAVLLILFLVPTTLMIHDFWTMPEAQMQEEMGNFMKNLSILGGLFVLAVTDPGRFSVDG